jgi:hypothetical protein
MVTFPFASSIHVPSISSFHFACIFPSSIIIRLPCALPYHLWNKTLNSTSCCQVSVITCESEPLIFVTPKFRNHRPLLGGPSPTREVSISEKPLHIAKRVTSLGVVSIRYGCRHWYLWFNTFGPSISTSLAILRQLHTSFAQGLRGSLCSDVFVCWHMPSTLYKPILTHVNKLDVSCIIYSITLQLCLSERSDSCWLACREEWG